MKIYVPEAATAYSTYDRMKLASKLEPMVHQIKDWGWKPTVKAPADTSVRSSETLSPLLKEKKKTLYHKTELLLVTITLYWRHQSSSSKTGQAIISTCTLWLFLFFTSTIVGVRACLSPNLSGLVTLPISVIVLLIDLGLFARETETDRATPTIAVAVSSLVFPRDSLAVRFSPARLADDGGLLKL